MRIQSLSAGRAIWVAILVAVSVGCAPSQDIRFGPTAVPATAVVFDPDNVLTADQLAALRSAGPLSPVPAVKAISFAAAPGQTITFAASGAVGCCSVIQVGPDGYVGSGENITGIGSISGFSSPNGLPLAGVFTNGSPAGSAPPDYDYTAGVGQPSFSPVLNQVFFIGDGLTGTGSGTQQIFNVPPAATELWLGFVDGGTFKGPPQNYGDNPGSLNVTGTLSITDCAALSSIDLGKISIKTYPTQWSNAGQTNPGEQAGYLYIYTGIREKGEAEKPWGIEVDLGGAIAAKPGVTFSDALIPEQVQNLVRWHGNAVYGAGANARTEYPAAVADGHSTPLFDGPASGAYPPYYTDSPDISVPLVDRSGLPLTAVCYEKDFKTYIGCQVGNPGRFHTMATFTWQAHYCGTVTVDATPGSAPTSASAHFTPGTTNAVTKQFPTTVANDRDQIPVLSPGACEVSFVTFDGKIPGHCK
jgi:hypothetical protein